MATKKPAVKSQTGIEAAKPKPKPPVTKPVVPKPSGQLAVRLGKELLGYPQLHAQKANLAIFLDVGKLQQGQWDALEEILLAVKVGPVIIAEACSVPPPIEIPPKSRRKPKKK